MENCVNLTIMGRSSKKTQKLLTKFQVLRLQAAITPKLLQIAGNSLSNWPSTGCLFSIFTVRINSKSFPLAVGLRSKQERYLPKFSAPSSKGKKGKGKGRILL